MAAQSRGSVKVLVQPENDDSFEAMATDAYRGDFRTGFFLGVGIAESIAWRTVRRCTPYRSASSLTESPRRASRRIASNRTNFGSTTTGP